ncbi:acyl-CoA N-acyltransferase [Sistotremastrum niveocremeum HHB9708]|uniref:Acyl-CoA N-acyltransferase n=2 Tax=Sistotremastraceae TaxID=3402574 RepID=A0A164UMS3_9AGAM|nr:acyl-CoA N-acyltransferase [Sistotremastrum niveocremeum HHB9708]KZT43819.1 acyl-CoA N-acyltransferase [Sistotremastrum suecicum HHB10207 ss-3]
MSLRPIPVLRGRNVELVPPTAEDDQAVADMRSHPETRRYLPFLPTTFTPDEARQMRENKDADARYLDFRIHYITPSGPVFAGTCGLLHINPENSSAEAGIIVCPEFHRTGLGTESLLLVLNYSFTTLKFHRISFETAHHNVQMRGWLENALGIGLEYRLREAWKSGSGWIDSVGYSILDREWSDLKEKLENRLRRPQLPSGPSVSAAGSI